MFRIPTRQDQRPGRTDNVHASDNWKERFSWRYPQNFSLYERSDPSTPASRFDKVQRRCFQHVCRRSLLHRDCTWKIKNARPSPPGAFHRDRRQSHLSSSSDVYFLTCTCPLSGDNFNDTYLCYLASLRLVVLFKEPSSTHTFINGPKSPKQPTPRHHITRPETSSD